MAKIYDYTRLKRLNGLLQLFTTKRDSNLKRLTQTDIIGPPDPVSNLRPIFFAKSDDETSLEKKYREARENTQMWNQNFWSQHNARFTKERKQFQESLKAQGKETCTADEMSVFYKMFLDKNWKTHCEYNIAWYKKNIMLLCLEMRVRLSKLKLK